MLNLLHRSTKRHFRRKGAILILYHVTYSSDSYRVKAYLGLPDGCSLSSFSVPTEVDNLPPSPTLSSTLQPVKLTALASRYSRAHSNQLHIDQNTLWPVLIYCRGGLGNYGGVNTSWIEQFVNYGYIVFAPAYRGNEGGEGRDEYGGSDLQDVVSAYQLVHGLPFADPSRISIMGFSRGAINAVHAAATYNIQPHRVHKLVLWSGVADVAQTYMERTDLRRTLKRVLGNSPHRAPEAYTARSPLFKVSELRCPVLIMHGTEDTQVKYSHGTQMYNELKRSGADVTFHAYGGENHHFQGTVQQTAISHMFKWLGTRS